LIVRAVVEDGVGRLQQEFEALKARLAAEGLFAAERKRALPVLPSRIAIVTSPTGAALQDFVRILVRRGWRGRLVVYPCKVQGEGAAAEIAAMIERAASSGMGSGRVMLFLDERGRLKNSITRPDPIPEVVVVGRGGGSLEDLWAFNEEVVVRAVAGCPVPVISAVGHEIDFSLCDFAADVRAETPSGAAELLSSRYAETVERVERAGENLVELADDTVAAARERVSGLRGRLRLLSPTHVVEQGWLRRDDLANRFEAALDRALKERRGRVREAAARVAARSPQQRVEVESQRLLGLWKRLQAASPASVLQRGFAIVRDEAGRPVGRAGELRSGQEARVEFRDGEVAVTVAAVGKK
jgi:exodeoxyribonuclease VII large subunit